MDHYRVNVLLPQMHDCEVHQYLAPLVEITHGHALNDFKGSPQIQKCTLPIDYASNYLQKSYSL